MCTAPGATSLAAPGHASGSAVTKFQQAQRAKTAAAGRLIQQQRCVSLPGPKGRQLVKPCVCAKATTNDNR